MRNNVDKKNKVVYNTERRIGRFINLEECVSEYAKTQLIYRCKGEAEIYRTKLSVLCQMCQ